jgi:hypothetical protein
MKYRVAISQEVTVDIDPKMFTPEFLKEFRESFYPFQNIRDHIKHLAQLHCRGLAHNGSFIEGYGDEFKGKIKFSECEVTENGITREPDLVDQLLDL